MGRGTVIGFIFGFIPGISHVISTFVSYAVERKLSKEPEAFGTGKIEGVAGPETANNATTGSAMIPLLVLGIPAIPATAILLSAMQIHGVQPGPQLISEHPDVFWGLIASMYIGNVVLLILNLPLVGIFVNLLRIPYAYLAPGVLLMSMIGIYSVNSNAGDIIDHGDLRRHRLRAEEGQVRPGAAAARHCPGRPPGGFVAPRPDHFQRRLVDPRAGRHVQDLHRRHRAAGGAADGRVAIRLSPQDGGGQPTRFDAIGVEESTLAHDPVRLELVKNAIGSVVDEMVLTVIRIAYSSIMRTRWTCRARSATGRAA